MTLFLFPLTNRCFHSSRSLFFPPLSCVLDVPAWSSLSGRYRSIHFLRERDVWGAKQIFWPTTRVRTFLLLLLHTMCTTTPLLFCAWASKRDGVGMCVYRHLKCERAQNKLYSVGAEERKKDKAGTAAAMGRSGANNENLSRTRTHAHTHAV